VSCAFSRKFPPPPDSQLFLVITAAHGIGLPGPPPFFFSYRLHLPPPMGFFFPPGDEQFPPPPPSPPTPVSSRDGDFFFGRSFLFFLHGQPSLLFFSFFVGRELLYSVLLWTGIFATLKSDPPRNIKLDPLGRVSFSFSSFLNEGCPWGERTISSFPSPPTSSRFWLKWLHPLREEDPPLSFVPGTAAFSRQTPRALPPLTPNLYYGEKRRPLLVLLLHDSIKKTLLGRSALFPSFPFPENPPFFSPFFYQHKFVHLRDVREL